MKPVELEILMKDGLTPGLKNAGRIVRQFSGDSQAAFKEVERSLKLQQEYVGKLEKELGGLEKSLKGVAAGSSEWVQIKKRIEEVTKEIENEKPAIDELKAKYDELNNSAETADASIKTQLRNLTQEIATLMISYARLSDEEKATAEGRALQRHIEELTEEAGVLRDAMADTAAAINNAASDTRGLDQLSGALQLAIDGFGLATGAAEIFGLSQKDLTEVQTKLQAAIVASNALSSIQTNLQKQSALMQGVQIIQTKAATAAENIRISAQGRGIIATKAATVAQSAFNAVAKANPYVVLAMSCLTVVGALYAFSKGSKAAKEAEEERQRKMEEMKQKEEDFKNSIVSNASTLISRYFELKRAWEQLGDSLDKRKRFIDSHKDAFRQLGAEINSVADAQKYLAEMTDLAIEALARQSIANAFTENLDKQLQPYIEAWNENRTYPNAPETGTLVGSKYSAGGITQFRRTGYGAKGDTTSLSEAEFEAVKHLLRAGDSRSHKGGSVTQDYYMTEEAYNKISELRDAARATEQTKAMDAMKEISTQYAAAIKAEQDSITEIYKKMGISQTTDEIKDIPKGNPDPSKDTRVDYEKKVAEELQKLKWKNEQTEIDQMEDGAEKRRRQIALNYEKQYAEIQAQEDKWKEAQNGVLTQEQTETISESLRLANEGMKQELDKVAKDEVAKNREKLDELLNQYKDYDQQRRELEKSYTEEMEILNAELLRLEKEGLDTTEIKSAISARKNAYSEAINSLQSEILQSSDFYDKLFGTVADKGYKVLKDFYKQAEETLMNAKMLNDGVQISVTVKDADGKFVKQQVKITVEEYQRMLKRIQEIRKQLDKDNPFAAMKNAWSDFIKATKDEDGDVSGALKELNAKGKEVSATIRGWGDALGNVLGDNFKKSMNEIMTCCDGIMDMGTGIAQIWSGDIVGGITNALNGLASIFSLFSSWKEKMEEMRREWYIAEIETNRALRERSAEYARNRSQISDIITDVKLLNWLIERGYAKPASVSVWDAESEALNQYIENLSKEADVSDELWRKLQGSQGHYEWGNSLNGGFSTWSLNGFEENQIELWYNQDKLSEAAKAYYEAWKESDQTVKDLQEKIEEIRNSMREMVMGVSFDSFLSNAKDALKEMRGDISKLGEFTEDTLANAILNGFMYKDLASVLEPLYNELSDAFIGGTADAAYIEDWRKRLESIMTAAGDRLGEIADAAGINLDGYNGRNQTGRAGGFMAISQDQGTKLEGLFVSVQMHAASIDEQMEDVADKMSQASERLRKIEENTKRSADKLDEMSDDIKMIIRDGIKTR
ncbi:MAG: hypothetical protein J1E95_04240 [Muribaculaceae bacterium]|nr:hypothetical protein [Muribaculaceae bacterium]